MCWRNGIWHPCVKIASPANTFAIISWAQHGVAQAALRPPYGARRQHLHEGWEGKGGNYNYCDFPFYRVYCIIIMWWESMMGVASADICGVKERVFGVCMGLPLTFHLSFFLLSFILFPESLWDSFLFFAHLYATCICTHQPGIRQHMQMWLGLLDLAVVRLALCWDLR